MASNSNEIGFGRRWNDFVVTIWNSLAVQPNDDSEWWLSTRQTDRLSSFWLEGGLANGKHFCQEKNDSAAQIDMLSILVKGFVVNARFREEMKGFFKIFKPMVWRRSDLEGGLANGKHNFRGKSIFGQRSNRFQEEIKRFCVCDFRFSMITIESSTCKPERRMRFEFEVAVYPSFFTNRYHNALHASSCMMSTLKCACIGLLHICVLSNLCSAKRSAHAKQWTMSWDAQHISCTATVTASNTERRRHRCNAHLHAVLEWSAQHNASAIDDVLCCCSSAHQSQNLSVPSDEAVIGEVECAAYYHQLMICSQSKGSCIPSFSPLFTPFPRKGAGKGYKEGFPNKKGIWREGHDTNKKYLFKKWSAAPCV